MLRALAATPIEGGSKRLLDEVDVISAVSGGAFTAAHYGLYGEATLSGDFEATLQRNFTNELLRRGLLCPYNGIRLMSPWFERSDLAAELYDETIFDGKTYADLQARGRPFVLLNATNLSTGERFEFTQDDFDLIGSALIDLPVGRAVAASSAFPFLLTPVTIVNYPSSRVIAPKADEASVDRTVRARARARALLVHDKERHPFLHLADGGVVDNLGLGALLDSYRGGFIRDLVDAHEVSTLVFIVVNARNRAPTDMDASSRAPGAASVVVASMGISVDSHTGALARALEQLRDAQDSRSAVKLYVIEVNLEDLADDARRERLLAVGTNYGLSPEDVRDVATAGAELLVASPALRDLIANLR